MAGLINLMVKTSSAWCKTGIGFAAVTALTQL